MDTIHEYLYELKSQLAKSDAATVQDALSDAEEYLSNAVNSFCEESKSMSEAEALQKAIDQYGTPQEIAAAYVDAENRLYPAQYQKDAQRKDSFLGKFFGVYANPHVWGSLLYILLGLVTGMIYFTWSVAGISFSLTFLIFIFGLFFLLFFLYSLRGVALLEGRIVEALLGERMPHRPLFMPKDLNWKQQLGKLLKDKHTWFTLIYTFLQMPFSVVYFSVLVVLYMAAVSPLGLALLQYGLTRPSWHLSVGMDPNLLTQVLAISGWKVVLLILAGIVLFTVTMHLAGWIGKLQGKWAKLMLVVD